MTLKAFCVTLGLLGLLSGYAIASPFNEGDERSNIKPEDAIELLVTCEASFPLLSLRWDDRDNAIELSTRIRCSEHRNEAFGLVDLEYQSEKLVSE